MKLPIVGDDPGDAPQGCGIPSSSDATPLSKNARRSARPTVHKPIPMQKLMNLVMELEDVAEDGVLSADAIEDFSQDQGGVPRATVYAAAVMSPDLKFAKEADVTFVCCAGGCQEWGGLDRIEQLLRKRQERLAGGMAAFDVHARLCLDRCEHAPVIHVVTPDGTAVIAEANEAKVNEALALLDAGS